MYLCMREAYESICCWKDQTKGAPKSINVSCCCWCWWNSMQPLLLPSLSRNHRTCHPELKNNFYKVMLEFLFLLLPRSSHFCCRLFCQHWADPQTCCTVQHSHAPLSLSLSLTHTHTTNLRQLKHTTACFATGPGEHWGCLQAYPTQWSGAWLFSNIWYSKGDWSKQKLTPDITWDNLSPKSNC